MTADEARSCVDAIKRDLESARRRLLDLYEREGWRALGYENWSECVTSEFAQSRRTLWYQLQAAQIEQELGVQNLHEPIPDSHLRPLAALDTPEERQEVWREAVDTAPDGRLTAAHVETVVASRLAGRPHVAHNTGENEWYTPAAIVETARTVLGGIDLDPASHVDAQAVIRAERFYTREQDGLAQEWAAARVWMNPPYSQPAIERFCKKLVSAFSDGDVLAAITLTNNGTETTWGQRLLAVSSAVCFPDGRVKFWAPGRRESVPLQGQMLCYLGVEPEAFCERFRGFGLTGRLTWTAS